MSRHTFSFVALIASLACFVIGLLLSTNIVDGASYHPWIEGGFIALVVSFLADREA